MTQPSKAPKAKRPSAPGPASGDWLETCLARIRAVRVAVLGDFFLDAYWIIDPEQSELSVETGLPIKRVREQRYSPGGVGTVVNNLVDLGVAKVYALGLAGQDLFGRHLLELLQQRRVDTSGLLTSQPDWQTMVYAKPYINEEEQNRHDFGTFNVISPQSIKALAAKLEETAAQVDVVVLNKQLLAGVSPPAMIEEINKIVARQPRCRFITDARRHAELYQGAILKLNAYEASRLLGQPRPLDEFIPAETAKNMARKLAARHGQLVIVTRGENGILAAEGEAFYEVPGIQIIGRTDPVGAGDTALSALAAVLGSGGDALTAIKLANLAASITVRKLGTTGTATPAEIRAVGPEPDYVYAPELADDPRRARYWEGTEIEIAAPLPARPQIRHALFDHDGTISTLREGWEKSMEPVMIRAILGPRYQDADETLYHKVVSTVRKFIDQTTGVQTLVQMHSLVGIVKQFGCVPEAEILDPQGYKKLYNDALMSVVHQRMAKLERGELDRADFLVKNVRALLERLHAAGVKLYLASGTDEADVIAEAKALGYESLFEGRIYGAVGDISVEAKRDVLRRIMREHKLQGSELAVFGDGPVEMREARRHSAICVGVASDEVRRFGLNPQKRARLIRAGANALIPDYSQLAALLKLLNVARASSP